MSVLCSEDLIISQYPLLHDIFLHMPCGAAMHRLVCDLDGTPIDYYTTEVNPWFSRILKVDASTVIGELASTKISRSELDHWLSIFGPVAMEGHTRSYVMYSPANDMRYIGTAICPQKGFFFVMFNRQSGTMID